MATVHDKYVVELAEVIKGYGNPPDVNDPFCLSEFYRFYEIPNVCVSAENFKKMRPLSDFTEENEARVEKAISCAESYVRTMPSAQPEQRWIPCSERMPKKPFGCLVTVWDTNPMTGEMFENLLPEFVGWDGEQWNDIEGIQCPLEVIAWMPLPEPYREEEQDG